VSIKVFSIDGAAALLASLAACCATTEAILLAYDVINLNTASRDGPNWAFTQATA
jgi:hypothetical protein